MFICLVVYQIQYIQKVIKINVYQRFSGLYHLLTPLGFMKICNQIYNFRNTLGKKSFSNTLFIILHNCLQIKKIKSARTVSKCKYTRWRHHTSFKFDSLRSNRSLSKHLMFNPLGLCVYKASWNWRRIYTSWLVRQLNGSSITRYSKDTLYDSTLQHGFCKYNCIASGY